MAVATGDESACAVAGSGSAAGRVWCWLLWSDDAGTDVPDPVWGDPRPVADLPAVTDVALGHHRGCAVVAGDAWCWQRLWTTRPSTAPMSR